MLGTETAETTEKLTLLCCYVGKFHVTTTHFCLSLIFSGVNLGASSQFSDFLDGLGPAQLVGRQTLATPAIGKFLLIQVHPVVSSTFGSATHTVIDLFLLYGSQVTSRLV